MTLVILIILAALAALWLLFIINAGIKWHYQDKLMRLEMQILEDQMKRVFDKK